MTPPLPEPPLYLPFEPGPYRASMGLVAQSPDALIHIDARYPDQLSHRRALLAEHGSEVAAAAPRAEAACRELRDHLFAYLPGRYPQHFTLAGAILRNHLTGDAWPDDAEPLRAAALLVQEDLCLLALRDGVPILIAGTLCFTPGWRLLDKLGLPLADVHGPVPFFADRLARPVDRFLRHLRDGKLVERHNWGLHADGALFRPSRHRDGPDPSITPENAIDRLFLRVERQTLSTLPETGAVLFGIGTHVTALRAVVQVEGAAARLREAVAALPEEMAQYKGILPFRDALVAALDQLGR